MQSLSANYPELLAVAVLVAGLIIARLARSGVQYLLTTLDARLARYSASGKVFIAPMTVRLGKTLIFWFVLLASGVVALSLLDVGELTAITSTLLTFLGKALVGVVILAVGHFVALLAQGAIERFTESARSYEFASRIVYGVIISVAAVMALSQLEIDTSFVTQLALVIVAVTLGGLALAFGLGAREHVANLLAQSEVRRFSVGERISIGDTEGNIVAINATSVEVQTARGTVSFPASHFATKPVIRLTAEESE